MKLKITKKLIISVSLLVALIIIALSGTIMSQVNEPKHKVLSSDENIEIREYAPILVAQVSVTGERKNAISAGFRILADYIFGNNSAANGESRKISMTAPVTMQPETKKGSGESQKIAMTAPVSIQQTKDKWRVQFTMPSQYTLQTLPKPNNPNIEIVEVPAQTYGVIKFSGLAGTEKVAAKTKELQSWMQAQNLTITGKPELARYNPPWTLPFMRRNEIMIAYQPK